MTRFLLLLPAISLAAACSRKPEPVESNSSPTGAAPAASAPSPAATTAPARPAAKNIVWTDPPGWELVVPTSSMRKATYKVPGAGKDAEPGEMAVFYFGGEGGSVDANIQRWIGQFADNKPSDVKRSQKTVGGMNATIVEVEGTYASGMPGAATTPKKDYKLIGAVVETPVGPYFFKLTGPKKTVEAARGPYMSLLESIKPS